MQVKALQAEIEEKDKKYADAEAEIRRQREALEDAMSECTQELSDEEGSVDMPSMPINDKITKLKLKIYVYHTR